MLTVQDFSYGGFVARTENVSLLWHLGFISYLFLSLQFHCYQGLTSRAQARYEVPLPKIT